jgi:type VI secretion system protein
MPLPHHLEGASIKVLIDMREHRLLDRIRLMDKNPQRRITEEPAQMIRSIQQHLQRILNTRQGSAPIAEDFGVPDFTNFTSAFPDSQRGMERMLRQTIQKYEPRLKGIRVGFFMQEDDPLTISFQITARLVLKDHKDPVSFESRVDSSGHVRLKSS